MTKEEIARKIVAFIQENLLSEDQAIELDETTLLLELGVLDSLKTAILLNYMRDELNAPIPPEKLSARNFANAYSIATMVCDAAGATAI